MAYVKKAAVWTSDQLFHAPFCGSVSNAETVFSNFIRCNGAPLCLMAQACLSSSGQRALSIDRTWLFNLLAFFIASKRTSNTLLREQHLHQELNQSDGRNLIDSVPNSRKTMLQGYEYSNIGDMDIPIYDRKQGRCSFVINKQFCLLRGWELKNKIIKNNKKERWKQRNKIY